MRRYCLGNLSRASLLGVLLWLAGCATLNTSEANDALAVSTMLGETLHALHSPEGEQRAALARAQGAFDADAGDVNRLRLATLLIQLPEPMRNDARAGQLLAPLAGERGATPGGRVAALLSAQLTERRKLAELAAEQERAASRREEGSKRQVDVLKRQLDALKAIERSIVERERRLPRNNKTR